MLMVGEVHPDDDADHGDIDVDRAMTASLIRQGFCW